MEYKFIHVDRSNPNLPILVQKYKHLRLLALKQSPSSFSSTYEVEASFSDATWLSRVSEPSKETFICVAQSSSEPDPSDEWVAQVTLLGPIPSSKYQLPEDAGQPLMLPDHEEEKWQMLSLYTLPEHRGRGIGKKLCQESFKYLSSISNSPSKVRIRIMVKPENEITLNLYRSLGFVDAGRCTLEEALNANGDSELVPNGDLESKYTRRAGIIMTKTVERAQQETLN